LSLSHPIPIKEEIRKGNDDKNPQWRPSLAYPPPARTAGRNRGEGKNKLKKKEIHFVFKLKLNSELRSSPGPCVVLCCERITIEKLNMIIRRSISHGREKVQEKMSLPSSQLPPPPWRGGRNLSMLVLAFVQKKNHPTNLRPFPEIVRERGGRACLNLPQFI